MIYIDTSALLKRYVDEPDSDQAEALLRADPTWATARITLIETRWNLARLLVDPAPRARALRAFASDWALMHVVELDAVTCETAAALGESTGARSLDALHLAAATRALGPGGAFLTFDVRLAQVASAIAAARWTAERGAAPDASHGSGIAGSLARPCPSHMNRSLTRIRRSGFRSDRPSKEYETNTSCWCRPGIQTVFRDRRVPEPRRE